MSHVIAGMPQTSLNLGVIRTEGDAVRIELMVRSGVNSQADYLSDRLVCITKGFGGKPEVRSSYPAWEYRDDSPLRDLSVSTYRKLYGKEPKVEVIHAGLECGILAGKLEGLDCLSAGPDLENVHTVRERMKISSVENVWTFVLALLYRELYTFLQKEYRSGTIYPPADQIFNALHLTPLGKVKVVILGQDPYHNVHQAHGLCFSVPEDQREIPPSLINIFRELHDDVGCKMPQTGCLTKWAQQGVLLLNTVLTVRAHQANSHRGHGWEQFTDAIIQAVEEQDRPIVYMLWGSPAQTKSVMVTNPKHLVLKAPHPSPLSAYRGFFGCRHFSQCNEFLEAHGETPIDWQL